MLLAQLKLLVFIFVFLLLPNQVFAQVSGTRGADTLPTATPVVAKPGPSDFSAVQTENEGGGILCQLVKHSPTLIKTGNPAGKCPLKQVTNPTTGESKYTYDHNSVGAMGELAGMIGTLYNPPTSTTYYLAHLGESMGFISPAYAQVSGSGESILRPVFVLWQVMRNLSYLLFILIFLGTGFMIMFRQKLNPQTVITVQAALPGLVIGLIMVTFSYFFAALMVDVAFVGIQIVAEIFIAAGTRNYFGTGSELRDLANNLNILTLWSSLPVRQTAYDVAVSSSGVITSQFPNNSFGTIIGSILGFIIGQNISVVVTLVIVIALFVQLFRLLFSLINSYLSILIYTIIGPVLLLYSSLPGKNEAVSTWWRTILGNALVFPAVLAGFLFAGMILGSPAEQWNTRPPFISFDPSILRLVVGFGILIGITAIPGMVKKAIGVKDIQEIPQAAMGGFMGGFGALKTAGSKAGGAVFGRYAEGGKKYREAQHLEELGLDRFEEAAKIRNRRTQAETGPMAAWNKVMNKVFYRVPTVRRPLADMNSRTLNYGREVLGNDDTTKINDFSAQNRPAESRINQGEQVEGVSYLPKKAQKFYRINDNLFVDSLTGQRVNKNGEPINQPQNPPAGNP